MKSKLPIILSILLLVYFPIAILSPISFYGHYSDVALFFIVNLAILVRSLMEDIDNKIGKIFFKLSTIVSGLIAALFIIGIMLSPGILSEFKVEIISRKINGNYIETEYYQPSNSTECGDGFFWKTKAVLYFPLIEYQTEFNDCTFIVDGKRI